MGALEFVLGMIACWIGFTLIVDRRPSFRAIFPAKGSRVRIVDAHKLAGRIGVALVLAGLVLQVFAALHA